MFDIRIVNLDVGSYLCMIPKKAISKSEKDKNDIYLQACLENRRYFTPMVYSADGIAGAEALDVQERLAAQISFNMKLGYS